MEINESTFPAMPLEATIDCIRATIQQYMNGEQSEASTTKKLGEYISSINFVGMKCNKHIDVEIIQNTKEPFFGARVYTLEYSYFLTKCANPFSKAATSNVNFEQYWRDLKAWNLEIDSRCFSDPRMNFTPDEITAFILYEVVNVIYTTEVPKMFMDAYRDNYFMNNLYTRRGIEILSQMYAIPLLTACMNKHWLLEDDNSDITKVSETSEENSVLQEYKKHIYNAVFKVIKNYGNTMIETDADKYNKISAEIIMMNKFANDYIHRKNEIKDMIIVRASHTSSNALKEKYMELLDKFGYVISERYTGALVESVSVDCFSDEKFLQKYDVHYSIRNKRGQTLDALFESIGDYVQRTHKGFGAPKLPCDRDIDMTFVDIDRMENQSDRAYVLDRIYRLMNMIVVFEDYYASNEVVMREMSPIIERQRKLLDEARERALAARSFSTKKYKVFVKVPAGYEG